MIDRTVTPFNQGVAGINRYSLFANVRLHFASLCVKIAQISARES